jgi:hypothetical protein
LGICSLATLPGEEDIDGLRKLLDPQTVTGRAARISLLTHGTRRALAGHLDAGQPSQRLASLLWLESQDVPLFHTRNATLFHALDPNCVTIIVFTRCNYIYIIVPFLIRSCI